MGAREALPEFLVRSAHADLEVRTTVAFHFPSVVDHQQVEGEAVTALEQLAHDDSADVRFYALHALLAEELRIPVDALARALELASIDGDQQIRQLAIDHAQAHPQAPTSVE
jgi:HEAT repeat protein